MSKLREGDRNSKAYVNHALTEYEYDKTYFYLGTHDRTYGSCKLKTTTDKPDCEIRMDQGSTCNGMKLTTTLLVSVIR